MKVFLRAAAALLSLSLVSLCSAGAQMQPPKVPASSPATSGSWEMQNSTTKAGLRGIHAVGHGVAWASGTNGTILRTEDGGYMWQSCAMPPGAEKLDFRGIWAWDSNTAVAMSSGPGDLSRVYKTADGCSSWKLLYTNPDKNGFWDAIAFAAPDRGVILGDPVSGWLTIVQVTQENGEWRFFPANDVPAAPSMAAFAASNSSVVIGQKDGNAFPIWIGTGGSKYAAVISHFIPGPHCECGFGTAKVVPVPLTSGNDYSGVFSLAFRDQNNGIAVGGDYKKPNESNGTAAYTADGGKIWTAATKLPHGYRSSVAWDAADKAWIAVGTNGSDVSYDGKTWQPLDNGNWNALSLPWVVGPEGRIAKLVSLDSAGKSASNPAK